MIDLYTAVKLCCDEYCIMINDTEYTQDEIKNKFDMRKIKVEKIYFDRWHGCLRFDTKRD